MKGKFTTLERVLGRGGVGLLGAVRIDSRCGMIKPQPTICIPTLRWLEE